MYLKDLARIIYDKNTASEHTSITVRTHSGDKRILWKGEANNLQKMPNIKGWLVVEVLIDYQDGNTTVDYNKGKIITVI